MNEDLIKRLEASIRIGAIDGDATERQIFECQVVAAISALRGQQAEIERLRAHVAELEQGKKLLTMALDAFRQQQAEIERLRGELNEARTACAKLAREHVSDFQAACYWTNEYEWLQEELDRLASQAGGGG